MLRFSLARRRAAACLLLVGSIALIGSQQVLGAVADAQTTEAVVDAHSTQPMVSTQSVGQLPEVYSAVPSGQFEDVVKPTPVPTQVPTIVPRPSPTPAPAPQPKLFESGIASTYGEGDGFEGNRTACGQVFHTRTVQIAHKTLPCGTLVHVVDTDTGNSVDARVTDRGPYVAGRVVDLSWGAFSQLDPTGPGLLHVNVYVVDAE